MPVSPILVLRVRAEARAHLFALGEFNLETAINPLIAYAESRGLDHEIGIDSVADIITDAFKPFLPEL